MIASSNKILLLLATLLLLSSATASAYFSQPYLLLLPLILLVIVYFIQLPQYLFYLLLAAIPWSVEFNFSPTLGTDLPDEPIMLLMSFATLLSVIFNRKKIASKKLHPILLLIILQWTWTLITVLFSSDFIFSAKYLSAKSWFLLSFVIAPLLLWQNEKVLKRSVFILFVSVVSVTVVSLIKHLSYNYTFASINSALHPFFRNHVIYSALLVFMLPVNIAMLQLSQRKTVRIFLVFTFLILIAATYFSYSRGAWLALVGGGVSYWLLKKKILLFSFGVVCIVTFGVVLWLKNNDRYLDYAHNYKTTIFHPNFNEHLAATYQLKDVSTAERFYRWIAGVRMVKDYWQTGTGPTTFYKNYKSYTIPLFKTWVSKNEERSTVHNYFLLTLIEQGVLGLLFLLILIGSLFWYAQKIYARTSALFWKGIVAAAAVIISMQCTVNFLSDMIETDKVGSIFYLCVALIVLADYKTRESNPATHI